MSRIKIWLLNRRVKSVLKNIDRDAREAARASLARIAGTEAA